MTVNLRHFKISEFDSPDVPGSGELMNEDFLILLDSVRSKARFPFKINSGYRTAAHNKAVGGKPSSAHRKGKAADIKILTSVHRALIIGIAWEHGIRRIGIGNTFIHLDSDNDLPSPRIWLY